MADRHCHAGTSCGRDRLLVAVIAVPKARRSQGINATPPAVSLNDPAASAGGWTEGQRSVGLDPESYVLPGDAFLLASELARFAFLAVGTIVIRLTRWTPRP